jgi:hypothetical protein
MGLEEDVLATYLENVPPFDARVRRSPQLITRPRLVKLYQPSLELTTIGHEAYQPHFRPILNLLLQHRVSTGRATRRRSKTTRPTSSTQVLRLIGESASALTRLTRTLSVSSVGATTLPAVRWLHSAPR